jgi:hypothetical protein
MKCKAQKDRGRKIEDSRSLTALLPHVCFLSSGMRAAAVRPAAHAPCQMIWIVKERQSAFPGDIGHCISFRGGRGTKEISLPGCNAGSQRTEKEASLSFIVKLTPV